MNNKRVKLEPVYLTTVLLYCNSEAVLLNYRKVSSNCRESIKMVKKTPLLQHLRLNFLLDYFPNIETIESSIDEINKIPSKKLESISWYELTIKPEDYINKSIRQKVKKIKLHSCSDDYIKELCNVEQVIIEVLNPHIRLINIPLKNLKQVIIKRKFNSYDEQEKKMFYKSIIQNVLSLHKLNRNIKIVLVDFENPISLTNKENIQLFQFSEIECFKKDLEIIQEERILETQILTQQSLDNFLLLGLTNLSISVIQNNIQIINISNLQHLISFTFSASLSNPTVFRLSKNIQKLIINMPDATKYKIANGHILNQLKILTLTGGLVFFELKAPIETMFETVFIDGEEQIIEHHIEQFLQIEDINIHSTAKNVHLVLPCIQCQILSLIGDFIIDQLLLKYADNFAVMALDVPCVKDVICSCNNMNEAENFFRYQVINVDVFRFRCIAETPSKKVGIKFIKDKMIEFTLPETLPNHSKKPHRKLVYSKELFQEQNEWIELTSSESEILSSIEKQYLLPTEEESDEFLINPTLE
ncbi:hypothetical protein EHI8A_050340 [Entamoeba histolytica HM-1:IMSS-B]|uniref:Uncharacterized protein n=5 Tax=Entamoeba histolytica TaxID=5759 RepID=C4M436_ENTH1|nr:hypothetical protein EHI_033730 [Entamoeba histolytica HM-1:IMSS]EMD48681.1 Hypothetical protein EHI5A_081510 [Entamoeba histolytica KU27]EMH74872.1 hypothetical protein EHI8A_050340 [Entamoeba histolytica HM-1:IMSS-B]ENY62168.1 hypothetical protein EHI7A_118860 [Entamoeba histolytica HM-1:IMSS-A]GAT96110.1 hypothetical protein CL6EHI_033730 [Entamoeba histolytica]EAL45258.1 hypothetical protein EHI_033730 [Entamoeba histolytica HM-1:IMSS]|eukprot:XP_650644.1 hypothetical protein EHI_033730 [Entamoeba histolytica HM-1:IMSS]